jgi:3'(2'), 5'-bisphosphate nucleotidase
MSKVLNIIEVAAKEAGQRLLKYYKKPDLKIITKPDDSPVTEADLDVSDFLIQKLAPLGIPVVTEENYPETPPEGDFFIIDPLDGTRYFIEHNDSFAVIIAKISNKRPVAGVLYFPAMDLMYSAEKGVGAFENGKPIFNHRDTHELTAFSTGFHRHPHGTQLMEALNIVKVHDVGSVLKMGYMARGDVDFYPRFGKTYEWDTAAGQIILEEGGCQVWNISTLEPLEYAKPQFLNHNFVCFRNGIEDQVRETLKKLNWKKK